MDLAGFDYQLPPELIAQTPLPDRAASRMLVLYRQERRWEDRHFRELPKFLVPGDCLVLNDSKVFPARLFGRRIVRGKLMRGRVQVFLLKPVSSDAVDWTCLVHPGRKMRTGEIVRFDDHLQAEILARAEYGQRTIRFHGQGDIYEDLERIGQVPLPPYIRRAVEAADSERYQTVFARVRGSVAAPTAGLHFTPEVLDACRASGADIAHITLHVGLGTFQPIHEKQVEQHRLHAETFQVTAENAARLAAARRRIAVGTTSVRVLEHALSSGGFEAAAGETSLFIYPGFPFRATGGMLTNFHLPRSSLLVLVCAFAGRDLALEAYRHAVQSGYRFYSYGDCMLIL